MAYSISISLYHSHFCCCCTPHFFRYGCCYSHLYSSCRLRWPANSRIYILNRLFYLFLSCECFLYFWHCNLLLLHDLHLLDLLLILHLLVIKQSLKLFRGKLCRIKHLRYATIYIRVLNDYHSRITNLNRNSVTLLV